VYVTSRHGFAAEHGNHSAPTCASCHGDHDILPAADPRAMTHRVRLPATCGTCHGAERIRTEELVRLPLTFDAYSRSVHGRGAARGLAAAASCADCHGVHDLRGPLDPASKINPRNVATTCGQCHPDIQLEYTRSIHGRALAAGVSDSPTCTDCHGEHLILSHEEREARTYGINVGRETCGPCHNDPQIIGKYGLQAGVVGTYEDSYHGWASRSDYARAATCVSCHTTHSVLPEEHPESSIHADNLVETCQTCHPSADRSFAISYTHATTSIEANPVNRLIQRIYIVLIIVTIGGMALHNLVIMNYYVMERRRAERGEKRVLRLDPSQIVQHALLTVSFILLVITGFALRFPEAWWVRFLADLGMTEPVRSDLHRVSAVLMILVGIIHIYYISTAKRGRAEFQSMIPAWQDVKDFFSSLRFYTWRTKERAKFGRYDYTQKAEYWALVWGTAIMVLTGLILWFPEFAVKIFPALFVPISQTIHYYEAWLATLAILVWHFFFVFFHPAEYPMSWTWLTGKMSEESVKKHHGRWYEEELADTAQRAAPGTGGDHPES
jgi:formate dehydrogenase gamma subunit